MLSAFDSPFRLECTEDYPMRIIGTLSLAVLTAVGCSGAPPEARVSSTQQASITDFGYISEYGMGLTFSQITPSSNNGFNLQQVVGLTACDPTTLYAVQSTNYLLYFSKDSGQTWTHIQSNAPGSEIACDHGMLVSMDPYGRIYKASTMMTGQLDYHGGSTPWSLVYQSPTVDHIQGGDGNIYGVKLTSSGNQVFNSSTFAGTQGALSWSTSPIATIGAKIVTGTGVQQVTDPLAYPHRAIAVNPDGTLWMNDRLLANTNYWTELNTGSERFLTLTAAASNSYFGLEYKNGTIYLTRINMSETNCYDGVDNDADGRIDSEDPACMQTLANSYCNVNANGSYCYDRIFAKPSDLNVSLVTCSGGAASFQYGVCQHGFAGSDYLVNASSLDISEPSDAGHWCNVIWTADGTWDFAYTTARGGQPCNTLLWEKPGGTVVRAGIFSTSNANNVLVRCSNGGLSFGANGTAALNSAYNSVGHGNNSCIFNVSPAAMPVFQSPYPLSADQNGRGVNQLTHNEKWFPVSLTDAYGQATVNSLGVNRVGVNVGSNEHAYDIPTNEGTYLYAMADGVVTTNGSRSRDVSWDAGDGSPHQNELYVQYTIGTDPVYAETFVAYYAHLSRRFVVSGQTVHAGQLIGISGASGATGGFAHLCYRVFRLSNTNEHTAAHPDLGYHVNFAVDARYHDGTNHCDYNIADHFGWGDGNALDPWAYQGWDLSTSCGAVNNTSYPINGIGAFSVNLFEPGQSPRWQ
jgi:murein DD-endopeptidase MepM/ murein hydrolase activator NlpD